MFSSISLYHQLHMFHLALTASHMALSPDGSALALADSERSHLEVYNLPGKLVAASGEEEGLTSNRDFGLVSGSVSCPGVTSVEYGDSRSVLTTSSHSYSVSLWSWETGQDLLHLERELCHFDFQPRAVRRTEAELVVWGERSVARTDMTGLGPEVRQLAEAVVTVRTVGSVSWCLGEGGLLSSLDWRQPGPGHSLSLQTPVTEACIFPSGPSTLLAASAGDSLKLWDVRSSGTVQETGLGGAGGRIVADGDKILVTEGSKVQVFSHSLERVFTHEAHKAEISSLLSHPSVRNLVISADSSNRLQAWVFNSKHFT